MSNDMQHRRQYGMSGSQALTNGILGEAKNFVLAVYEHPDFENLNTL